MLVEKNTEKDLKIFNRGTQNHADNKKGFENVVEPLEKNNFFYIISGRPGSGKTNWLYQSIAGAAGKNYNRKFDSVHLFSPSLSTIDIPLPRDRLHSELDMVQLENILKGYPEGSHNLIIIDDFVANLKKNSKTFLKMILNRRHLSKKGGSHSVMITTQKYTLIPLELRNAASSLVLFDMNRRESKLVFEEVGDFDSFTNEWSRLTEFVFDKKYNFMFIRLNNEKNKRYYKNFDRIIFEE